MKFCIILISLFILCSPVYADEIEFGEWYGIYNEDGQKELVGFSGRNDIMLIVYVDDQLITRLRFNADQKITKALFDGKEYPINYKSLYGYDHWIRRMKKHYRMMVWFDGNSRPDVYNLKGFSKGINWLYSK